MSSKAAEAIRSELSPDVEFLPVEAVDSDSETYFCLHVRSVSRTFDVASSTINERTRRVKQFQFLADRPEYEMFRIREAPTGVFVTEKFVQLVQTTGLNGFRFLKVWPFPAGVNWVAPANRVEVFVPEIGGRRVPGEEVAVTLTPVDSHSVTYAELVRLELQFEKLVGLKNLDDTLVGQLIGGEVTESGAVTMSFDAMIRTELVRKIKHWATNQTTFAVRVHAREEDDIWPRGVL